MYYYKSLILSFQNELRKWEIGKIAANNRSLFWDLPLSVMRKLVWRCLPREGRQRHAARWHDPDAHFRCSRVLCGFITAIIMYSHLSKYVAVKILTYVEYWWWTFKAIFDYVLEFIILLFLRTAKQILLNFELRCVHSQKWYFMVASNAFLICYEQFLVFLVQACLQFCGNISINWFTSYYVSILYNLPSYLIFMKSIVLLMRDFIFLNYSVTFALK